ncbi:MAG: hypothetical protein JWR26_4346, partial [Pedosphaera sp.]|nr:hypothetical protein [Pedosphaera sp.]
MSADMPTPMAGDFLSLLATHKLAP